MSGADWAAAAAVLSTVSGAKRPDCRASGGRPAQGSAALAPGPPVRREAHWGHGLAWTRAMGASGWPGLPVGGVRRRYHRAAVTTSPTMTASKAAR